MNKNKCSLIEYLIFLKLLMENKNIYFHNNFYKEWVLYLVPLIELSDYCKIEDIISRYNIKNNILKLIEKNIYIDNLENTYISIFFYKSYFDTIKTFSLNINLYKYSKIFNLPESISLSYPYIALSFVYNIPENIFNEMKNLIKLTFKEFDAFMLKIWLQTNGLFMDDYLNSKSPKKIIYFIFYNKIIKRLQPNKIVQLLN